MSKKTFNEIKALKESGVDRPEDVDYDEWRSPKKISPRMRAVAHMLALGLGDEEIVKETGVGKSVLARYKKNPDLNVDIQRIQNQLFLKDPQKRFNQILPKAIDTAYALMENEDEKGSVRADIAFKFMDRALGRPKETIDVKSSSIKELFEKLDQEKAVKVIEVESDSVEKWIEKNLSDKDKL